MGTEIERKFLVDGDAWRVDVEEARRMRQGYVETDGDSTVRIRLVEALLDPREAARAEPNRFAALAASNDTPEAWLTIKGPPGGGDVGERVRPEFEYAIPHEEAEEMLELFCGERQVRKIRFTVSTDGDTWVVDRFGGRHTGLALAEIELDAPDASVTLPDWIGEEVTGRGEYTNAALARRDVEGR